MSKPKLSYGHPDTLHEMDREELEALLLKQYGTNTKLNREKQELESRLALLSEAFWYMPYTYDPNKKFARMIEELNPELVQEYYESQLGVTREANKKVNAELVQAYDNLRELRSENITLRAAFNKLEKQPETLKDWAYRYLRSHSYMTLCPGCKGTGIHPDVCSGCDPRPPCYQCRGARRVHVIPFDDDTLNWARDRVTEEEAAKHTLPPHERGYPKED